MVSCIPVSYTHLDVYKRQYNTSCQLVLFVLADSEMVGLLCLQRVKHQVNGVFELLVILPAVSYTHLDVYKRQL